MERGMDLYQGSVNGIPFWYSPEEHHLITTPPTQPTWKSDTAGDKYEAAGSVKAIWLSLTNTCNLRCPYCFTSGLTSSKTAMSKETAESSVEFLIREALADSQGNRTRTIILFGGEPLLKWELITHTVEYAKRRTSHLPVNIKFMLATNGTLLTESQADFLADNGVTVQLSLDGPEDVHNKTRISAGGKGSHDKTLRGAEILKNKLDPASFSVRPTVTESGPSYLKLSHYFMETGIKSIFLKNVIPQCNDDETAILDWLDKQRNEKDALAELTANAHQRGISLNPMLSNAMKLLRGVKNESACAAGNHALSISPEGKVFPCHRYEEDTTMSLSDSIETLDDKSRLPYWQQLNDTLRECGKCWARNFCEKGCPASNHFSNKETGTFSKGFCETKKFEAEVSLKTALLLIQKQSIRTTR